MKYKTTKKASDLQLDGIKVELDHVNDNVSLITLTDAAGKTVRIVNKNPYSTIRVEVPAPPKMKNIWIVSGKFESGHEMMPLEFETEANNQKKDLGEGVMVQKK